MNSKKRHPLEKSLAVFPLVLRNKANLVTDSFSPRPRQRKRRKDRSCQRIEIRFPETTTDGENRKRKGKTVKIQSNVRAKNNEEKAFLKVQGKLSQAVRFLPKRACSLSLRLPPILSSRPSNINGHHVQADEGIANESCQPRWKPCTCGNKKNQNNSSKEDLTNMKLRKIAQTFHPEETPRLFSIYVRWKLHRNGSSDYDRQTLVETFSNFGELSNIIFKSRTSAVVVFATAEAACTTAKVFARVGAEMKLFVRWLNDM